MWKYEQKTGRLFDLNAALVGTGWSGQGIGKNNPDAQNIPNIGPLPRGVYTIGQPYHHPKLGPLTMNLTPDPANEMESRADFRIHGAAPAPDTETSSEGCIIQYHPVRQQVANSQDNQLQVI